MSILENFQLDDLNKMNINELNQLSTEIRETIISSVSKNGGHLASNLGVVELTIGLHIVFHQPKDKIIFDVSHQTYAHKILTGRLKEFDRLGKSDGISGFSSYEEGPYDSFETGHSSTSISAGIGFLEAKKVYKDQIGEVVAFVGDASLMNGLCFEALNYLSGHKEDKMIIIINDNGMSISKNTSGLEKNYNKIRTSKSSRFVKGITPLFVRKIMKSLLYKVHLFTSFGFHYFEGLDGHDFNQIIKYLNFAKNSKETVVLHFKTKKGKGFLPAEQDTLGLLHSVSPFDKSHPELIHLDNGVGNILAQDLQEYSKNHLELRVLTPAMAVGCGLTEFEKNNPGMFIDCGICEESCVVMASSLALANIIPVVFGYTTFFQRAYDEFLHDITRPNVPAIFCMDHFGIVDSVGSTHQGIYGLMYVSTFLGMKIYLPATLNDAREMLSVCLKDKSSPSTLLYPYKLSQGPTFFKNYTTWYKKPTIDKPNVYLISYGEDAWEFYNMELPTNVGLVICSTYSIDDEFLNECIKNHSSFYVYETVVQKNSLGELIRLYLSKVGATNKIITYSLPNIYLGVLTKIEALKKYNLDKFTILNEIKENN